MREEARGMREVAIRRDEGVRHGSMNAPWIDECAMVVWETGEEMRRGQKEEKIPSE